MRKFGIKHKIIGTIKDIKDIVSFKLFASYPLAKSFEKNYGYQVPRCLKVSKDNLDYSKDD